MHHRFVKVNQSHRMP